jgi:hypothetical protein
MTVQAWLEAACADADRRGLAELTPLLESLARAMQSLRDADSAFAHPAAGTDDADTPSSHAV